MSSPYLIKYTFYSSCCPFGGSLLSLIRVGYLHWKLKEVYLTENDPFRSISACTAARCTPLQSNNRKTGLGTIKPGCRSIRDSP
jgi:hypothetical protein